MVVCFLGFVRSSNLPVQYIQRPRFALPSIWPINSRAGKLNHLRYDLLNSTATIPYRPIVAYWHMDSMYEFPFILVFALSWCWALVMIDPGSRPRRNSSVGIARKFGLTVPLEEIAEP